MIKYILLGLLDYAPQTGYELKQLIDSSTAHFWHAYHSQIYTTLRQMEKEKLVVSQPLQAGDHLKRRVYALTPHGKSELENWLAQPLTGVSPVKEELLVRLFFSARRNPGDVLKELEQQREQHRATLRVYQDLQDKIPCLEQRGENFSGKDMIFHKMTLDMGLGYEKMYLEWLDDCIQIIQKF